MKNSLIVRLFLLAVGLCLVAGGASGAVYLDDFDPGGTGEWTIDDLGGNNNPYGAVVVTDVDGDADNELRITAANPAGGTDIMYTTPTLLGGADNNVNGMVMDDGSIGATFATFDFWANGDATASGQVEPAALEFYFSNGTTSWRTVIHGGTTVFNFVEHGWSSIYVSWYGLDALNWYADGGSDSFDAVLGNSIEMGIILTYSGLVGQEYGIDNFELNNPEPSTYAVLAFALMSLGLTFRGKLRSGLKGLLHK